MSVKKGGLNRGKGLESLIPQTKSTSSSSAGAESKAKPEVKIVEKVVEKIVEKPVDQFLKTSEIVPKDNQPRKEFEEDSLAELAASIKQHGVLQPILVQKKGKYYEIIAGERRWRAAKLAGLKKIPVVIKEFSEQEAAEIALIENIQREDLNAIEEAQAYKRLIEEFGLKQEELADRVAKNRSTVTNAMRLLNLPEDVQEMVSKGDLSSGHARTLLPLPDDVSMRNAASLIISEHLSVRQTEQMVKRMVSAPLKPQKKTNPQMDAVFAAAEERLKSITGTKVSIHRGAGKRGKIEIEYYSQDELDRLLELFERITD